MSWRWRFATAFILSFSLPAAAQLQEQLLFPLFVDGASEGIVYRSSLRIVPLNPASPPTCTLTQRRINAAFTGVADDRYVADVFDAGDSPPAVTPIRLDQRLSFEVLRSTAQIPLRAGYANLACSGAVHTELQIALLDRQGVKLGETSLQPAAEGSSFEFLIDRRDGTRLGFSLANDSAVEGEYTLIARDDFNQEVDRNYGTLAAWSQVSRFVDEMLRLPANFVGRVELVGVNGGRNYAIGLQFTGPVFATIPPIVRTAPLRF